MGKVVFWAIAIGVFILDRITKELVRAFIPLYDNIGSGFISLTHLVNTGTAFGMFKNFPWVFSILAILVSIYLVATYTKFDPVVQPVLGLVLGGAMGNAIDRFVYGAVVDFISVRYWPAFNVADISISIAIVLLLVLSYKRKI